PDQLRNRLPQLGDAFPRPRARHDRLVLCDSQRRGERSLSGAALASRKLVALREGRKHAGLPGGKEVLHRAVVSRGRAPDVEQPYDPDESRPLEAAGEQALERRPVGLARLRVAVPGEVEQIQGEGRRERSSPVHAGRTVCPGTYLSPPPS